MIPQMDGLLLKLLSAFLQLTRERPVPPLRALPHLNSVPRVREGHVHSITELFGTHVSHLHYFALPPPWPHVTTASNACPAGTVE